MRGRNGRGAELYVLFHDGPAGIIILNQGVEEGREIDVTLADDGEHFVLDGLFKSPLIFARLLQNFYVAIFYVNEAQFVLYFFASVTESPSVDTMASVET